MNRRQQAEREGRVGQMAALRSVLIATAGQAKVEELYRVLKADEAARFLGLAEDTLRNMTYRHEIPHVKTGKRGVGYRLISLIEWQDGREVPARA